MPSFTEWLQIFAPTWLQDDGGKAILGAMGAQLDRGVDLAKLATKARFPEFAPPDGLAKIGIERQIPQAPWETLAAWATYLRGAWEVWGGDPMLGGGAGTPVGILAALSRSGLPFRFSDDLNGKPDATTYVQWNGRWVQLYADMRTPIFGMLDGVVTRPQLPSPASSFLPTSLGATLKLWLRGDLGIAQSGGIASAWTDQSGNGNNVTGSIPYSLNSINGNPGLTFSSAGMINTTSNIVTGASPRSVFAVLRQTASAFNSSVLTIRLTSNKADYMVPFQVSGKQIYTDGAHGANSANLTGAFSDLTGKNLILQWQSAGPGTTLIFKVNGVPYSVSQVSGSSTDSGTTGFSIGGSGGAFAPFIGEYDELIVCDTLLSPTDESSVYSYLSARYHLSAMPTGIYPAGWYDGNPSFASKSWLLFPSPGGVVAGLDNSVGNQLKAKLNATVDLWKGSKETYGGAWIFDSANPDVQDAPPGSDEWAISAGLSVSGALGWPPSQLDPFALIGDSVIPARNPSLKIDPA